MSNFFSKKPKIKKNIEKYEKFTFFKKSEHFEEKKKIEEKKNATLLVLLIEEISLQPELFSPAHFRIQGGYPERYGRTNKRTEDGNSCV